MDILCCKLRLDSIQATQISLLSEDEKEVIFGDSEHFASVSLILPELQRVIQASDTSNGAPYPGAPTNLIRMNNNTNNNNNVRETSAIFHLVLIFTPFLIASWNHFTHLSPTSLEFLF